MRRIARGALLLGLLGDALARARPAHADPLPIELSWQAPSECPSHEQVMAELVRITRVKPGRMMIPIRARATIEHTGDARYRLRLRTEREDQTGDTELEASTCAVLKRGVTLVLALALGDGVDVVDEPAASPEPTSAPSAPTPAPPPRAVPTLRVSPALTPPDAAAARNELRWQPWLAATGAWGLIAKPSLGPQLGLGVGQAHWQAWLQLSYFPSASAPSAQAIDASFRALVGALGACLREPFAASWSLSACALLDVGAVHGASRGAFADGSATAPWYALGPGLVLVAPLHGRLKLRVAGGLSVAFEPPHFAIRGLREVYVVSRYVPTLSLGLAL